MPERGKGKREREKGREEGRREEKGEERNLIRKFYLKSGFH